jgi:hypothetical protein
VVYPPTLCSDGTTKPAAALAPPQVRSTRVSNHRTSLTLLGVAAFAAVMLGALITFNRIGMRQASNVTPSATVGIVQPHAPLDKAPGVPPTQPKRY